jgi:ABC-2 type transport system permease protein
MRNVLTMAAKDLRLMARDWLGMFFIIGFPILMGIFFGSMYGDIDASSAALSIAVVDEDNSTLSARFIDLLDDNENVEIEKLPRQEAMDRVRRGKLVGMIAIPKDYGETAGIMWMDGPAIEVGIDPSRKAEAGMLQGMIMQAAGELMMARFQDAASMRPLVQKSRDEIVAAEDIPLLTKPLLVQLMNSLDSFLEATAEVQAAEGAAGDAAEDNEAVDSLDFTVARIETIDVTREIPKGSNEALVRRLRSKWDISFPQAMLWGVLACAAGFAITLVRERKQGTFFRLQVAPVTRSQVLAGKAMACFITVLAVIAVMVTIGVWLGMRPRSPLLLALASVSIAICFVGIMNLMSVIGKTAEAVSGAAWGANMIMAMFGGAMVPLLFMPQFMKTLSDFSPVKWSIVALEGLIWRGFTPGEMLLPCGILIGVGVVCWLIGATVLSRRVA